MRYQGMVYRPPSEAYSLIVQVTYGCSHNTCAFCSMYKEKRFALRPLHEVLEDFQMARQRYRSVRRIFLADGDALIRKASELYTILDTIRELFPECERVTSYASPSSIRLRTEEEFPHEVGLFLSYPPEDVQGFIDHRAMDFKCAGLWKVYSDEERAQRLFTRFKRCTEDYCARWQAGSDIGQLAVAM